MVLPCELARPFLPGSHNYFDKETTVACLLTGLLPSLLRYLSASMSSFSALPPTHSSSGSKTRPPPVLYERGIGYSRNARKLTAPSSVLCTHIGSRRYGGTISTTPNHGGLQVSATSSSESASACASEVCMASETLELTSSRLLRKPSYSLSPDYSGS